MTSVYAEIETSRAACAPSLRRERACQLRTCRVAASRPAKSSRRCSSSPSTTAGTRPQREPLGERQTARAVRRGASSCRCRSGPTKRDPASSPPHLENRADQAGTSLARRRRLSVRTTTSPLRTAGARPRRSSHGSYGLSTRLEVRDLLRVGLLHILRFLLSCGLAVARAPPIAACAAPASWMALLLGDVPLVALVMTARGDAPRSASYSLQPPAYSVATVRPGRQARALS